jgi:Uma2 family endonuclease
MPKTAIKIGPRDRGRRMSLEEFDHAKGQTGYLYELSRGVVTVMDVPDLRHLAQVKAIHDQLADYQSAYPGRIYAISSGRDCRILLAQLQTQRRPDLAIYTTPPPKGKNIWSRWLPAIAIEVVSPGSEFRDYEEKSDEYYLCGLDEYWIFDADKNSMRVHYRSGERWIKRYFRPPATYRTRLLIGLEIDPAPIFEAAGPAPE